MWRRWLRWWRSDERSGDANHVSRATLQAALRHEETRGVDYLPQWKTPKEVAEMRRAERRAALRLVRKTGTDQ